MGITRVRLTGPTRKVAKALPPPAGAGGPEMLKDPVIPSWAANWVTCGPVWLMVVLLVGKKPEKVLPAALKLTVIGLVAKRVTVSVTGLLVLTW